MSSDTSGVDDEDSGKSKTEIIQGMKKYTSVKERLEGSFTNLGRTEWVDTIEIDPSGTTYNIADSFSGAGGLTLGFTQANYQPVFGVETDPDAAATYERNFPEAQHWHEDIREVSLDEIREAVSDRQIHVLCAGFPCPGFSIAGSRNPDDDRNFLYEEIIRIARELEPWYLALENVPGLVTMDDGKSLDKIRRDFEEIGYPLSTLILEAADYGVAQIRSRAILIGNRFGLRNPYPKPLLNEEEYIPIGEAIDDLADESRNPDINHEWTNHGDEMIERISKVPPGESLYDSYKDAWKRQRKGVPAMAVKENHGGTHIHHEENRVISAREMARLQGFPEDFIFEGRMKRVMFQVGNAVPVPMAKHVALALRPKLKKIESGDIEGDKSAAPGFE
jgi:DNA (cytosine-5)-methyltransferase 1